MRRFMIPLGLVVLLAACAPFQPAEGEPEGVTLTFQDGVFLLVADPPVLRAFLRVPGQNLSVEHEDCDVIDGSVECILGVVQEVRIPVMGDARLTHSDGRPLDLGVVCREECYSIGLDD